MCAGSTRPAVHPVSNPECLITAAAANARLTWQGKRVEIHLQARRFRCRNNACDRKIFAERLPDLAGPKARETTRLCEIVGLVGYVPGGLPGERLLHRLGIVRSDDTVLRRVKSRGCGTSQPKVRVLGVNDWAWRKRQRYGTMLMDLELLHVIDLLPVRSAAKFRTLARPTPGGRGDHSRSVRFVCRWRAAGCAFRGSNHRPLPSGF